MVYKIRYFLAGKSAILEKTILGGNPGTTVLKTKKKKTCNEESYVEIHIVAETKTLEN